MKKTAFWELLNLIFCKIYDEKRKFICIETGESYRREFWVGVKEQNSVEGRAKVAKRIKSIFNSFQWLPQAVYTDKDVADKTMSVYQHIYTNYPGGTQARNYVL